MKFSMNKNPRIGRILERFRSTGMVQRVPRIDRLNIALWSAMTAQYQRRGEDWMLKKGGFQRLLNPKQQSSILSSLKKGKLKVEEVEKVGKDISSDDQMLLLNLLGGRLPLGHRMVGYTSDEVHREIQFSNRQNPSKNASEWPNCLNKRWHPKRSYSLQERANP